MSETKLNKTAQEPTNGEQRPTQTPPALDWRWWLTMGLSIGIGIAFARHAVPAIWPSLDDFWGPLVGGAALTGLVTGTIALTLGWVLTPGNKR